MTIVSVPLSLRERVFYLIVFAAACMCGCDYQPHYKETRLMMGTYVEVTSPDERALTIVFTELGRIESLFSKYKSDSEVSLLNDKGELQVSRETFDIIAKSKSMSLRLDGAFDVTIGPLMDMWGFTDREYSVPEEESIREALTLVGGDKIVLEESKNMVKFNVYGMKIDLGAVAKGYAVDAAVQKLRSSGIRSCLINAGGDLYCLGTNRRKPWRIAIRDPRSQSFIKYLELTDRAVATSGDYEQYFIQERKQYQHIIDPRTGFPAESGVSSVTVVADDCFTADVLATAIMVLGKEKSKELLREFPGVETVVIE